MNTLIQTIGMFLLTTFLVLPVQASDSAKEQRWAQQIANFLVAGEPIWLAADGQRFLSLYTHAAGNRTKGAVILLHGRGTHPDWPQVIQPLRSQLPAKGWATLSLQMPVLQYDASDEAYVPLFKDVPARIQAGLDFLSEQGVNNIILLGHRLGSNMATAYLATHPDPRIKAFVGINMMGQAQPAEYRVLDNAAAILKMKVPVLDVYGAKTYHVVLESADRRAFAVYKIGQQHSRQIEINDADHFFQWHEKELVQVIANWMTAFSRMKPAKKLVSSNNPLDNH